ncbi:sororin [Tenrec ecaudatus]|uniref:sororin n=1 Tax=Tenrec ecaudatus TaxID=94439 RepID=UPI003F59372A
MSRRQTRSGGAAQRSGSQPSSPDKSLRRSQRKSGSDLQNTVPEIWPKTPHAAPVRKPIVLKKIVAHTVEIPAISSPRRSPRIAIYLEKENNPPRKPTEEDLQADQVPLTPTCTPVLLSLNGQSSPRRAELDTRDLEMSKKVRRSYSRLEAAAATTSTPGRRSCFGFERLLAEDSLATVSPVVASKPFEVTGISMKPWAPDTTLPGISPPAAKEKRKKKKMPEILKSELDEWAATMNAEFEAAEQFDLLVE